MIFLVCCIVLLMLYYLLISYYHLAWMQVPTFTYKPDPEANEVKVSVIIPARNEQDAIARCLDALLLQHYPPGKLEIIVIDDHSTDQTAAIAGRYQSRGVKLVKLQEIVSPSGEPVVAFKKKAIEAGINVATGTLIITTDADCTAGPDWIPTVAAFYNKYKSRLIAAPVRIISDRTLLSKFQSLDFAILQGITGASVYRGVHNMCNGANLAYERRAFFDVGGFTGIDNIASGDDMLLMQKIKQRYPHEVHYLKSEDAIVSTTAAANWRAFFRQRIRWASKTGQYKETRIVLVLLLVYLLNVNLAILLVGSFFIPGWILFFWVAVFYKTIIEWAFVKKVLQYFQMQRLIYIFPFFQPMHILYTVIAGFLGSITKYEWKGRKVK